MMTSTSTGLASRVILLTVIGSSLLVSQCGGTTSKNEQSHSAKPQTKEQSSSLNSPSSSSSPTPSAVEAEAESEPESRLLEEASAEAGILLPFDDDNYPTSPGEGGMDNPRMFPQSVQFPAKTLPLRVSNGKAIEHQQYQYGGMVDPGQAFKEDMKRGPTYFIRNSCFGPRCLENRIGHEEPTTPYFTGKEGKSKRYDDGGSRSNANALSRYEDNVMESVTSNMHSQLAIPFMVYDDKKQGSTFGKRVGLGSTLDRYSNVKATTTGPEGWVKLKAISPDAYDPFRFTKNQSGSDASNSGSGMSSFSKRDSSSNASNKLFKRVGVELNPESFADRWGWSGPDQDQDRRGGGGGSRLPAWLEEQLKYGNRNSDQDKNWVKLEPIPVAGVSISKWVPKGTPANELPTTSWQTNRDKPNGGSPWWDRVDDNRISSGGSRPPFLRPSGGGNHHNDDGGRYNDGGWGSGGGGGGSSPTGSSLSSFDRYPTNSWKDIIYPEGPQSATVSWQQSKGMGNRPSSFAVPSSSSGGGGGGWGSGSDNRKTVATGSWSAPPSRDRFPSSSNNRYNDHRASSSSYPLRPGMEDDPRWVLISNTRRVTAGSSGYNRGNDLLDRSKILSYINRLHPDHDRRGDYSSSRRHVKDYWPIVGGLATSALVVSPNHREEAFRRVNATLSSLSPVLVHRSGPTLSPSPSHSHQHQHNPYPSRFESSAFDEDDPDSTLTPSTLVSDIINASTPPPPPPLLSNYLGDGRGTSTSSFLQSSTSLPIRAGFPGRLRQGIRNINPVYAAVGAGMIPATLAAVMPIMLGRRRRRRRDTSSLFSQDNFNRNFNYFLPYFQLSNPLYSYLNAKRSYHRRL